jgi:iron complex transport system substrate-binding protein
MKLIYLALVVLCVSCANKPNKSQISDAQNICKYSKWLRISETKELITIEIINPDNPNQIQRLKLPNFNGSKNSTIHYDIEQPILRLACLSNTHVGMLSALSSQHKIVAVSDVKYIYDAKVKSNNVISLGDEGVISPEKIIKSKAQAVIYSGFSNSFPKQEILKKVGILAIPDYDFRETNVLGRAEWVLLFGYLTGNASKAKAVFNDICSNYQSSIKRNKKSAKGPVMISGNLFRGKWDAPAGQSYHSQLFRDAGMNYVYFQEKGTVSIEMSIEKALASGNKATLWLNPGKPTKEAILNSNANAAHMNPMKNGKIYCYSHDSNKYWELSACRPDLVLSDYIKIQSGKTADLFFYKQVK